MSLNDPIELTLDDLGDETGTFLDQCREAFIQARKNIMAYRDEHGVNSHGQKGSLTFEVSLLIDKKTGAVYLPFLVKEKMPGAPVRVCVPRMGINDDDQPSLFNNDLQRPSNPGTVSMFNRVDQETGEVAV